MEKIRQKTAYGATAIARRRTKSATKLIPSSRSTSGAARPGGIRVSAMPTTSAVKITASMSFSTSAFSGYRGTILTNVLMPNPSSFFSSFLPASSLYCPSSSSFFWAGMRSPGRIAFTRDRPMAAAHAVVTRK